MELIYSINVYKYALFDWGYVQQHDNIVIVRNNTIKFVI